MQKEDLIAKNPLRVFQTDSQGKTVEHRMGLLMARAGLGKTAILVQIALDSIIRGNQVLHVSIGQNLEKTKIWYDDIFKDIADASKLENAYDIYGEIVRNRLIMTFNASSFSRPKLEERLNDMVYQNIFRPTCMVIDGFDFKTNDRSVLEDIRSLAEVMEMNVWFSAVCHRDDDRVSGAGVPAPCHDVDDLFDTVVLLKARSDKENLVLNVIKDTTGCVEKGHILNLDPVTHFVKEA